MTNQLIQKITFLLIEHKILSARTKLQLSNNFFLYFLHPLLSLEDKKHLIQQVLIELKTKKNE